MPEVVQPQTGLFTPEYISELRQQFGMGQPDHPVDSIIKTLEGMTAGQLRQVRDAGIWQLSRPAAVALEGTLTREGISHSLHHFAERQAAVQKEPELDQQIKPTLSIRM